MTDIYSKIKELKNGNTRSALCIITETKGSTPRKSGAKMIVLEDKHIFGTIGGGIVEKKVIEDALKVIKQNKPDKFFYQLEEDFEMHCGGTLEVYIEPIIQSQKLYIFGAGHVGRTIAKFASELDFRITLFDQRNDIFKDLKIPNCNFIQKDYFKAVDQAAFDENTYIVITTHKHSIDENLTATCAKKPHAYLGMIGSKNKVAAARKRFLEKKLLTEKEIDEIDMPIGIKLAAETPQEIAVSIVAKLIDTKNKR